MNFAPDPEEITFILVKFWRYPIPELTTFTDVILPLVKIAVNTQPDPFPSTISSGGEVYKSPPSLIKIYIIFPLTTIGYKTAPEPLVTSISGSLL